MLPKTLNAMKMFIKNELFTKCQSAFLPGNSRISQLFSIAHEINLSFDFSLYVDARGIFLDISKAFDKVWNQRLLHELGSCRVKGKLLNLLSNYLFELVKRLVLNGQCSNWERILSQRTPKVYFSPTYIFDLYKSSTRPT